MECYHCDSSLGFFWMVLGFFILPPHPKLDLRARSMVCPGPLWGNIFHTTVIAISIIFMQQEMITTTNSTLTSTVYREKSIAFLD